MPLPALSIAAGLLKGVAVTPLVATGKFAAKVAGPISNIGWAFDAVNGLANKLLPSTINSVSVTVSGSRQSSLDDLLKLAVAVATGVVSRFQKNTSSAIEVEIDHIKGVVSASLAYQADGAVQQIGNFRNNKGASVILKQVLPDIKAGPYPPFLQDDGKDAEKNPQPLITNSGARITDSLIATKDKAANPFPQFDGVSRSTDLTAIISAALSPPCCPPPTNLQPQYDSTKPVYTYKADGAVSTFKAGKLDT